jgi:hypothetical protein
MMSKLSSSTLTLALTFALALALTLIPHEIATAKEGKNPYGTGTIDPAAPNEVILTITKGSRKVEFAYPRLQKLKLSTITIYEPFLKKRQSFSVIPLKNLFNLAGISGKDQVKTTALNDYTFAETAENFISAGAFLAIKVNNQPIGYDQGGPIRLIFSDKSKWSKNLDAWNWSLASISVR